MNRTKLKNYAPQARKDFIQAVTAKAAQYGLTAAKNEPMTEKGDVVLIAGKPFPKALGDKRKRLEERIKNNGFEQTMEAMAYTWFNRLVAIRYMELHGYLEHGFRVLSNPEGHSQPEILEKAQYVDLPELDQKRVIALKLDGTKEEELFRLLLTAQFNALSKAMPFLFEKIDDETELLLPDSLLNSDSLIRKLVTEIDEEDWKEVEIIGWLYQFYISEKKDEVIGKVVKSEDIPAATQLFTPNWIVKYLVQNTIGRQWLATYPQSSMRSKMEYYIEPAEQTPEVQEQLKAITPTSLNPEELTLLDPACGSGHILVEAYDLFKAIYEERGYRSKDIPALILQKNLFGLEIDDRAAQLAAFALMMKARADYPRIFDIEAQPNIVSFVESKGLDADEIYYALMSPLPSEKQSVEPPRPDGFLFETENNLFTHAAGVKAAQAKGTVSVPDITKGDIASLIALFENAKTFGSLIQVPPKLAAKLTEIKKQLDRVRDHGDLTHHAACVLEPILKQADFLSTAYNGVVANPPYMGGNKAMNSMLKDYSSGCYPDSKADLFAMFLERGFLLATRTNSIVSMVTMETWMFLSAYDEFRKSLLSRHTPITLTHMPYEGRGRTVMGIAFGVAAMSAYSAKVNKYKSHFCFVQHTDLDDNNVPFNFPVKNRRLCHAVTDEFHRIPGSPVAYWTSESMRRAFERGTPLGEMARPRQGLATSDNARFLRIWHEVDYRYVGLKISSRVAARESGKKWFPYNKGGAYRRWYGNNTHLINWENDGAEVIGYAAELYGSASRTIKNQEFYFLPSVTWTFVSSAYFGVRRSEEGFVFDVGGSSAYPPESMAELVTGFLCSNVAFVMMKILNPSLNFQVGNVANLPWMDDNIAAVRKEIESAVKEAIFLAKSDWDSTETSWDFLSLPVLQDRSVSLEESQGIADTTCRSRFRRMKQLEEENNRYFIIAYGLEDELSPAVPDDQITFYRPDREEDIKRLLSYSIGCVMGRYSLDKPGLIYAHSANEGFDPTQYKTFRADDDGIIPLLESDWGIRDDAANRIFEFISVSWPKEHLDENLKFIADSLTPSNGEQPKDTIRRYLATGFYKHHMSMYKKRPIYWMFSSGKQRAFQCLVYLHRYNEGTLARMRTEYVIPLMGKMTARLEHLQGPPEQKGAGGEIAATSAVTVKRKLEKERDNIKKQLAEFQTFDEKLRHYADLRIKLDLDDGVKVNYGKFSDLEIGDVLADVKAICGMKDED
jgi:type II restriction/modification system DNA methylase subunit YeeA